MMHSRAFNVPPLSVSSEGRIPKRSLWRRWFSEIPACQSVEQWASFMTGRSHPGATVCIWAKRDQLLVTAKCLQSYLRPPDQIPPHHRPKIPSCCENTAHGQDARPPLTVTWLLHLPVIHCVRLGARIMFVVHCGRAATAAAVEFSTQGWRQRRWWNQGVLIYQWARRPHGAFTGSASLWISLAGEGWGEENQARSIFCKWAENLK